MRLDQLRELRKWLQTLVRLEQQLQRLLAFEAEVFPMRQQGVPLPLDEAAILARQPGVLALAHLVHGLAQVTEHVELVVQEARLRCVAGLERRVAKRRPHIHHRQADFAAFAWSQPGEELIHARLGPVGATKPDRPAAQQVADDDAIGLSLANGDFVDANDGGRGRSSTPELLAHVLHLQGFDGLPIEVQFARHVVNRRAAAAAADVEGKAFGVEGIVRQPGELLLFHGTTPATLDAANLELQVDTGVATGQVADPPQLAVVMGALGLAAHATSCFFRRRCKDTRRALGSPKMPRTMAAGRKPGNRYVSGSRMIFRIQKSCQVSQPQERRKNLEIWPRGPQSSRRFTHTLWRRALILKCGSV